VIDDAGLREDRPTVTTARIVLDLTGPEDLCTQPGALERVRTAYAKLDPGERLEVRSTITEHAFAVRVWSRKHGVSVVADEAVDGYRRLVLEAPTAGV
jgi:TusA-related sulfurtransferase